MALENVENRESNPELKVEETGGSVVCVLMPGDKTYELLVSEAERDK